MLGHQHGCEPRAAGCKDARGEENWGEQDWQVCRVGIFLLDGVLNTSGFAYFSRFDLI